MLKMKIQRIQKNCSRTHHTFAKCLKNNARFRVAHIHIMANCFIATNAAIDITFTFISFVHSFFSPSSFHSLYPLDYCFVIITKMMAIFIVYERKLKNPRNSYGPMLCSHYIIILHILYSQTILNIHRWLLQMYNTFCWGRNFILW